MPLLLNRLLSAPPELGRRWIPLWERLPGHLPTLLDRIFRDPDSLQADVAEVMGPPITMVEFDEPVDVAFEGLQHGPAVLVVKAGQALGVLTRSPKLQTTAFAERRHYSHDSDALERAGISTTGRE